MRSLEKAFLARQQTLRELLPKDQQTLTDAIFNQGGQTTSGFCNTT